MIIASTPALHTALFMSDKYKKGDLVRSIWDGDFGVVVKLTSNPNAMQHRCYLVHWSSGDISRFASEGDLATSTEYKKLQELPF